MRSLTVSGRLRLTVVAAIAVVVAACNAAGATSSVSTGSAPAATTPSAPANKNLILATTTSLQDSGLLDILVPAFEKQSGYVVKTVAVGTGQALKMGQDGNADVLFVHAPTQEQDFINAGWGVDRRLVAHNYFVIVGPSNDPAGVKSTTSAADAFKKIAAAGATFVSRGDGSGTETKELGIWKQINITPKGNAWYLQSGQGMGPTLQIASEKKAYTLTDLATYLANKSNLALDIVLQNNASLINIYSVIAVNPAKWSKVNSVGAKAFEDYVTSAAGQAIIGSFGKDKFGQALFIADAGKQYTDLK